MEIYIKNGILVLIMILLGCMACREPLFLTEVSGTVNNTEECNVDFLYIYEGIGDGRAVDSASISPDGSYYVAFSGASLLEMRGNEQCGSDYHIIEKGFRQTKDFLFKPLRSGIEIVIHPDGIDSNVKNLDIHLNRMLETSNNSLFRLAYDYHNVNIRLTTPIDTLINLTLVDQQFYQIHISGLDSMNTTIFSISDTIKVDANLSEIVF